MIKFNTGRWYTEYGQRMAADRTEDGGFLFVDVDRMIDGYIPPDVIERLGLQLSQPDIMYVYDRGGEVGCEYWVGTMDRDDQLRKLRNEARLMPPALGGKP